MLNSTNNVFTKTLLVVNGVFEIAIAIFTFLFLKDYSLWAPVLSLGIFSLLAAGKDNIVVHRLAITVFFCLHITTTLAKMLNLIVEKENSSFIILLIHITFTGLFLFSLLRLPIIDVRKPGKISTGNR